MIGPTDDMNDYRRPDSVLSDGKTLWFEWKEGSEDSDWRYSLSVGQIDNMNGERRPAAIVAYAARIPEGTNEEQFVYYGGAAAVVAIERWLSFGVGDAELAAAEAERERLAKES